MTNKISTVIIDTESQSASVMKLYLEELEDVNITGIYDNVSIGGNFVLAEKPDVVIIDISTQTDLALSVVSMISTNLKDCKIIVTSTICTPEILIKSMRAGAREFLPKPVIKNSLFESFGKIKAVISGNSVENNKCKVITTFSNKGGIGKTTIASNLALELANITKEKVALLDLNLQLGDVATFLDLNPSFDISYLIQNFAKIDESFLLSTMSQYKETGLYVLADPPFMEQTPDITPEQIGLLIDVLKKTFSYIVIDTSASFDAKTVMALDASDLILLISIVNLPAIRNCQRCLNLFDRLGYEKEKTRVVINRYMENDEIKAEDVEDVIKRRIFWKIPNNYFTIMTSINKGLPVSEVNSESNVAQSYRDLAATLSDNMYNQDFSHKVSRKPFLNDAVLFM